MEHQNHLQCDFMIHSVIEEDDDVVCLPEQKIKPKKSKLTSRTGNQLLCFLSFSLKKYTLTTFWSDIPCHKFC